MRYAKRILNLEEACDLLGFKKSYIYKLTSQGLIPYSRPTGKKLFFDREKLEAWMLSNANDANIDSIAQSTAQRILTKIL